MCIFVEKHTHIAMRTNIIIDDKLMKRAMDISGAKTKKATVEKALELLIRMKNQENIRSLKGKLFWEGDLDTIRTDA